jgi:inorganic pyrophosphatase
MGPYDHVPAFDEDGHVNVVIETPKGSRNKIAYDGKLGIFRFKTVLPEGSSFPYDFGFIPGTKGQDGDPLDVLLLLDSSVPMGCLVTARLLGVIAAEQRERDGEVQRNDRVIAVATHARTHADMSDLPDLRTGLLDEIEAFFVNYNRLSGRNFEPIGRLGSEKALEVVRTGLSSSG